MNVNIGGKEIKRTKSVKSLGVIVDENLSWKEHIDNVCTKLPKAIETIRGAKTFVQEGTLKTMYNTLVLSHFDYCSLVWHNCSQTLKSKIQ